MPRPAALVYAALLVARVVFILGLNHSYVHPDEHFQSCEVALAWISNSRTAATQTGGYLIPWEYNASHLSRSTIVPEILCGWPFRVVRRDARSFDPGEIAAILKGWRVFTTFFHEWIVFSLFSRLYSDNRDLRYEALAWRASSWVAVVFLSKPFSNALESLLLDTLFLLHSLLRSPSLHATLRAILAVLAGALLALGCFVRITFPAFALPLVIRSIYDEYIDCLHSRYKENRPAAIRATTWFMVLAATGFASCALAIIALDSHAELSANDDEKNHFKLSERVVIAPLRNLLYNVRTENLATHGLHPRYTHVLLNAQLLFGPLLALSVARWYTGGGGFLASVLTGLFTLSLFPHQEPRFLVPLLLPLVVCAMPPGDEVISRRFARPTWVVTAWVLYNCVTCFIFGYAHQGGVAAAMRFIGDAAYDDARTCVMAQDVYMLPRYLMGDEAVRTVRVLSPGDDVREQCDVVYCVGPRSTLLRNSACTSIEATMEEVFTFSPHFNAEAIEKGGPLLDELVVAVWRS